MTTQTHDQLLSTIQEALKACGYTGPLDGGNVQTRTPLTGEDLFAIRLHQRAGNRDDRGCQ